MSMAWQPVRGTACRLKQGFTSYCPTFALLNGLFSNHLSSVYRELNRTVWSIECSGAVSAQFPIGQSLLRA